MLQTPGPTSQFPLLPPDAAAVSDPFTLPHQQYPVVDWLDDLSRKRSAQSFMQKLLETTQVSQSVIVLSLHYIYRLKERNRYTTGQPGSEFRIAVAGLMMANKFLDEYVLSKFFFSHPVGSDRIRLHTAIPTPTRLGLRSLGLDSKRSTEWNVNF
jgi:hypothetical protein